ncbi:MAG: SlyX family protein [Pseudomonadota bacterium]
MADRLTQIEETLAHCLAEMEDMSAVIRAQEKEIARLRTHVDLLLAAAAADQEGTVTFSDSPPPHY